MTHCRTFARACAFFNHTRGTKDCASVPPCQSVSRCFESPVSSQHNLKSPLGDRRFVGCLCRLANRRCIDPPNIGAHLRAECRTLIQSNCHSFPSKRANTNIQFKRSGASLCRRQEVTKVVARNKKKQLLSGRTFLPELSGTNLAKLVQPSKVHDLSLSFQFAFHFAAVEGPKITRRESAQICVVVGLTRPISSIGTIQNGKKKGSQDTVWQWLRQCHAVKSDCSQFF